MPDYKEMYLIMMRAVEKAVNLLIEAQQKCEELYIAGTSQKTSLENTLQKEADTP